MLKKIIDNIKTKHEMDAAEKAHRDDESNMKHIWGIKSFDDLTPGNEASLWTMNDFDITYFKDEDYYSLGVETVYQFDSETDKRKYINGILMAFTKWMKNNGYSTDYKPDMVDIFTNGININSHFGSIEEAYGVFKALVQMYEAQK